MYKDTLDRGIEELISLISTAIIIIITTSYPGVCAPPKQVLDIIKERGKTVVMALSGKIEV